MTPGAAVDQEVVAVLRERAEALARRRAHVVQRDEFGSVTVAMRAGVRLAVPTAAVAEVRIFRLTPLPHATAVVASLAVWQGTVIAIVDPASLLNTTATVEKAHRTSALVLRCRDGHLGLRVDEIEGTRMIYRDEVDASAKVHYAWVTAVTRDVLTLIDPERLCCDPQVYVGGGPTGSTPTTKP